MVESPGVTLGIDAIPSVEQIADRFAQIADLAGAREYESAGANVPKLMAGLFGAKR